ncbi:unnamed protein product, partial [Meganyctiphanes norvegica]
VQLFVSAMQMSLKVTCLLVLLALSACFTPALYIHFNRGWGASGSAVGKRGGSFKPMEDMALLDAAGCSQAISQLTDVLSKLMQSSVSEVVACELGRHSGNAVTAH